jgi:hypothetical protein
MVNISGGLRQEAGRRERGVVVPTSDGSEVSSVDRARADVTEMKVFSSLLNVPFIGAGHTAS